MRIIFMGTPGFALPAMQGLIASSHEIIAAYTQPARPSGRGQKLTPSPIQALAESHQIPVFTPTSLKTAEAQAGFAALAPDLAVVAAYGLILPEEILRIPKHGCINIHPSNLPRWRGAAPLQRAIMAGDSQSACCIMQMDQGLDTGAILAREKCALPAQINAGEWHDKMAKMGADMLMKVVAQINNGTVNATAQPEKGVTYAAKITKDDLEINWKQPAQAIYNHIRGLSPAPGAYCMIAGERVKILKSEVISNSCDADAGTIFKDNNLYIQAGDGLKVRLITVKRAGKPMQAVGEILANWAIAPHV
jgi:methionyl-tRNA formyltransferase